MTSRIAIAGALGFLTTLMGVSVSHAQTAFDRSRNVGVLQRPHPEYDALGIRAGQFLIYPKIETGVIYDTNVYAAEDDAVSDEIFTVKPTVSVESQWSRHALEFSAGLNIERYTDLKTEDTEEYRVATSGRIDIRRDANISGAASVTRGFEPRGTSAYLVPTVSPIRYDESTVSVSGVKDFNRLRLSSNAAFTHLDYQDGRNAAGAIVDQDYRDSDAASASVRLDYAVSPATAVFGEIGAINLKYDEQPGVQNRDSNGARVLLGANFELANLVTGEVSAGYITRAFDDGVTSDVDQFAYRASVNWYPTQLVTFGVKAEKRINDSGLLGTPAYVADTAALQVDYELLRNLIVTGSTTYSRDSYQDLDRTDDRIGAQLTATYLINRRAGLSLTYSQFTQDSSGSAKTVDYTYRTLGLALVLQL